MLRTQITNQHTSKKVKKQDVLSVKCSIEWCTERASKTHGPYSMCSQHARWVSVNLHGKARILRGGRFAARCRLEDSIFGEMPSSKLSLDGTFQDSCSACGALYFLAECNGKSPFAFTRCCRCGSLADIPLLPPAPPLLAELLTKLKVEPYRLQEAPYCLIGRIMANRVPSDNKAQCQHFQEHIRSYNAALGFASYCDNMAADNTKLRKDSAQAGTGPPVYVMHGRVYHKVSTLYPNQGVQPKYAQLYILDQRQATEHRFNAFQNLNRDILQQLHAFLVEGIQHVDGTTGQQTWFGPRNPFPGHFMNMHEKITAHRNNCKKKDRDQSVHVLRFSGAKDKNPKTYNAPSSAEVSCVVVGEGPLPKHFISVYERPTMTDGCVHNLSPMSEHVDPLTYPLIHVMGTLGHSTALRSRANSEDKDQKQTHISTCDFYAFRMMQRYSATSRVVELPFSANRLFQQYICDAYAKVMQELVRFGSVRFCLCRFGAGFGL